MGVLGVVLVLLALLLVLLLLLGGLNLWGWGCPLDFFGGVSISLYPTPPSSIYTSSWVAAAGWRSGPSSRQYYTHKL